MNGTAEQAEIELLEFPSPTGICLCDIHPTRIDRRRSFRSGGPCFEVVADRAIDGDDARRPSCSLLQDKTTVSVFHGLPARVLCPLSHPIEEEE